MTCFPASADRPNSDSLAKKWNRARRVRIRRPACFPWLPGQRSASAGIFGADTCPDGFGSTSRLQDGRRRSSYRRTKSRARLIGSIAITATTGPSKQAHRAKRVADAALRRVLRLRRKPFEYRELWKRAALAALNRGSFLPGGSGGDQTRFFRHAGARREHTVPGPPALSARTSRRGQAASFGLIPTIPTGSNEGCTDCLGGAPVGSDRPDALTCRVITHR
jgi:hypothetical protein